MSKESYARGFCKAAEAAGVDPNELMKFAQQFKTDGWAPKSVVELGREYAPKFDDSYSYHGYDRGDFSHNYNAKVTPVLSPDDAASSEFHLKNNAERGVPAGREGQWELANKKALKRVNQMFSPIPIGTSFWPIHEPWDTKNERLARLAGEVYHDSMLSSTGDVGHVEMPLPKITYTPSVLESSARKAWNSGVGKKIRNGIKSVPSYARKAYRSAKPVLDAINEFVTGSVDIGS